MRIVDFKSLNWTAEGISFASGAAAASVALGTGEAHTRLLRLDPGGEVAPHETGFGQLFVPIVGEGWVSEGP
jgi:hypothetical protein